MKNRPVCLLATASALLAAVASPCSSAIVRFNATINSAQEDTGSNSTASGSAVLVYDVTANRFDLTVTINDFANTLTVSHIHEAAPGVSGPPMFDFGSGEANYTRDGSTLTAAFASETYTGDPATLLSGGAYLNYHTASWPGGEVRGQLVPEVVKLNAILTPGQEPPPPPVVSSAYGALQASYDPMSNEISMLVCIFNFTNTLTNSHIHEAPVGVNGGVTLGFGGPAVYNKVGNAYVQYFAAQLYPGSVVNLLSEGAYFNVHSNVYGSGEIRGQLYAQGSDSRGRVANVSARGKVGTGDEALITGFVIEGSEPVRVLATARGPVLASFGVSGVLADPTMSVYDSAGNALFANDNLASAPLGTMITASGLAPSEAAESVALLVLPPGAYTSVVSGAGGGTGIALAEAFELVW
ncbi:MAG TPA: CHRD domain-containing protein [Opitutaceae bacterium]